MIVDSTNTGSGARSTRLALEFAATEQAKSQGALCLEKGEWPANERCWSMANLSLDWVACSSGNLEERGEVQGPGDGLDWGETWISQCPAAVAHGQSIRCDFDSGHRSPIAASCRISLKQ